MSVAKKISAAKPAPAAPAAPVAPPAPRLPLCIFGIGEFAAQKRLTKDLLELGMNAFFARNEEDFNQAVERDNVFAVFFNPRFIAGGMQTFQALGSARRAFWAIVSPPLSQNNVQMRFYNMGFADVLTTPVHPVTFKGRARLFLTRYARDFKFPDDVVLPPEILKALAAAPTRPLAVATNAVDSGPVVDLPWRSRCADPALSPWNIGRYGNREVNPEYLRFYEGVMNKVAPQSVPFRRIDNPAQFKSFLREALVQNCEAVLWTPHQKVVENFKVESSADVSPLRMVATEKGGVDRFAKKLRKQRADMLYGSIQLRRGRIFFREPLSSFEFAGENVVLRSPQVFYSVQRRKFFRLPISTTPPTLGKIQLKKGQARRFELMDISAGGMCMALAEADMRSIQLGLFIPEIEFTIFGKTIRCGGRIKRISPHPLGDAFSSVGVEFVDLDPADEDGLQLYVMEESKKYLKDFFG